MLYLDYLCKSSENYSNIIGTCYEYCPKDEIILRKREKLVHILEVNKDGSLKLVKEFSRSAADSNMAIPKLLRPYHVLKEVVNYMLHDVAKRMDVPQTVMYDFLTDRLRAVRQDMTIQRLPREQCVELLDPNIRFHVFFALRLRQRPLNEYDPILNKKYLLECLKWFLSCCDEVDRQNKCFNIDSIADNLGSLSLNKDAKCDRELIECLYILCNLDNIQPILRYLNLPKHLKCKKRLRLSYEIALAVLKQNFIRACWLSQRLCPLTRCAFYLYLPTLIRHSLQILSSAYNSKQLTVPTAVLQQWLLFNTIEETTNCCRHYGLTVDRGVLFNKAAFKSDVNVFLPKCDPEIEQMKLEDILTHNNEWCKNI